MVKRVSSFLLLCVIFLLAVSIPTVNSQPEDIQILDNYSAYYVDDYSGGKFHVVGEVQNVGSSIQNNVRVHVTLYNKTGGVMTNYWGSTTWTTEIYADHLLPQQKAPFKVTCDFHYIDGYNASDVDSYDIEIVDSIPVDGWQYQDLEIVSNSSYSYEGSLGEYSVVEGEVTNTGSTVATGVKVVVTFYNASGVVLDARWEYVQSGLPYSVNPGETVPFTVYIMRQFVYNITSYSLLVQCATPIVPEFPCVPVFVGFLVAMAVVLVFYRRKIERIYVGH